MQVGATPDGPSHTIYIISGGVGASAEQVVYSVLAQFPNHGVQVITIANVRLAEQIQAALELAHEHHATVVHTLVDASLRHYLIEHSAMLGVTTIDLMGPLFERLEAVLGRKSLGQPGLYRQLNRQYFDRIAAIDFALSHDDGQEIETVSQAEIILTGPSRVGKTPLSMYLAVLGWKVANIPLAPELEPPSELFHLDGRRVFGLTIAPAQLMLLRQQRMRRIGAPVASEYTNPEKIYEELVNAEHLYRRAGFTVLDVTDKPIESCADEILRLIAARFNHSTGK
jgi:hypothetical protein